MRDGAPGITKIASLSKIARVARGALRKCVAIKAAAALVKYLFWQDESNFYSSGNLYCYLRKASV